MLLKLDTREAEKKEEEGEFVARTGYTEFVSHTVWAHQMDFEEWKRRYRNRRVYINICRFSHSNRWRLLGTSLLEPTIPCSAFVLNGYCGRR